MKHVIAALIVAIALLGTPLLPLHAATSAPTQSKEEKILNIFNWSEYIPQSVLDDFTKETGIKVVYATFESNEAMYTKVKLLRGKGYDLLVPSIDSLERLIQDNLLTPLDKTLLGDVSMLDPAVMNQAFDPHNAYSVPYMWGVTGLMVNTQAAPPQSVTSWNDLMRPEFAGRVLLSDDLRDAFSVALKALGHSINTTDEPQIQAAYEWLKRLKPAVRVFDVSASKQAFISEETLAGVIWNGDAFISMRENPNLTFIYPKEGAALWLDSLVIPAQAEHKGNAYAFIRFLLRPEIAARCVEEFSYTTPNLGARALLDPKIAASTVILPGAPQLTNSEFQGYVGESIKIYNKYWELLKTEQ